jgi:NAD(P)-dependent dehydrogenase (short-subunit alcohol dehydrogenase family)
MSGLAAYQTAKWGLEGFSEVLANEVKPLGIKVTIVEPGAFRTDWAGSSMRIPPVGDDYEPTVGVMSRNIAGSSGNQPGDPARAAKIITDIVDLPDPPLRLLLGAGAVASAAEASRTRAAEAERWADVSRSADFPARQPAQA